MTRTFALILLATLALIACDDDADPSIAPDAAVQGAGGAGGEGGAGGAGGLAPDAATEVDAALPDAAIDAAIVDAAIVDAVPLDALLPDAAVDMGATCTPAGVVRFMTADGVELVADFAPAGPRAAILLHMIPPGNTRANYPEAFISALTARGISVINVDRRGAGDSEGVAREAYTGPNGWLDAQAARAFLLDSGCGIDPARVTIVGASNGTTTALDYAIRAEAEASPSALVFLTGGAYTETQHAIAEHRVRLDALPILFVFSTAERQWSAGFSGLMAAASWQFEEFADGAHGTRMFSAVPESVATVAEWIDAATP